MGAVSVRQGWSLSPQAVAGFPQLLHFKIFWGDILDRWGWPTYVINEYEHHVRHFMERHPSLHLHIDRVSSVTLAILGPQLTASMPLGNIGTS